MDSSLTLTFIHSTSRSKLCESKPDAMDGVYHCIVANGSDTDLAHELGASSNSNMNMSRRATFLDRSLYKVVRQKLKNRQLNIFFVTILGEVKNESKGKIPFLLTHFL